MEKYFNCELYTLNGIKGAYAYSNKDGTATVQAKDGSYCLKVTQGTFERKIEDDKPLFYAC